MPTSGPQPAKIDARRSARAAIDGLDAARRTAGAAAILMRLSARRFTDSPDVVLAYLALPDEPDLDDLIRRRIAAGLPVAAPAVDWQNGAMRPALIDSLDHGIVRHRHGVREPTGPPVQLSDLGCVLAPGLAFDPAGGRLGRGGGFYDRFLARARSEGNPLVIGVAFDEQIMPVVPMEEHDAVMDAVLTPTRWLGPRASAPLR